MNIEIGERFLPIGTIVVLKGGTKKAMITGFCSVAQEDSSKIYDYSGCIYPEGYVSSNQVCLFDHSQIEQVFFKGYIDDEEKMFKEKLNSIVAQVEGNTTPVVDIQPETVTPIMDIPVTPVIPTEVIIDSNPVEPVTPIEPVMDIPPAPVASVEPGIEVPSILTAPIPDGNNQNM